MFFDARLRRIFATAICFGLAWSGGGCDSMITPRSAQVIKDAESKSADGNYLRAITLYESALDGSAKSAEVHYRLALLYDDKMHDPVSALHHFRRYLTMAPSGPRATEVKNFMKKAELGLGTSLSGDSVVSRTEAARLKNENLTLRRELDEQRARLHGVVAEKPPGDDRNKQTSTASPKSPSGSPSSARSYVVRDGDTLASISRKFYKSSAKWKKIQDANRSVADDPGKLKVGETLIIP